EFVARFKPAGDVDLPTEDVRQLGDDAFRHAGFARVFAQPMLDASGKALHFYEVRKALPVRLDALAHRFEHEQRLRVDLVPNRFQGAGVTVESQRESATRMQCPKVVDLLGRLQPWARFAGADAPRRENALERVATPHVDVLFDRSM